MVHFCRSYLKEKRDLLFSETPYTRTQVQTDGGLAPLNPLHSAHG